MEITLQESVKSDLPAYTDLLQQTYQDSYTNEKLGLTKECFSKEIFHTKNTQDYLVSNLLNNTKQKCWLAFVDKKLAGSITILEKDNEYELRGFYVLKKYQGRGIGKKLWEKVISYARNKDITLDIYAHNKKTIEMYKKWGFIIDTARGELFRHWPEWPEGLQAKALFMRYHHNN